MAFDPVPDGLGGHPCSGSPGDGVFNSSLLLDLRIKPLCTGFQAYQIGDQAVAKQCHGMAVIRFIIVHRFLLLVSVRINGERGN